VVDIGRALSRLALAAGFVSGGRHVWQHPDGPAQGAETFLTRCRRTVPLLDRFTDRQLVRANACVHMTAGAALKNLALVCGPLAVVVGDGRRRVTASADLTADAVTSAPAGPTFSAAPMAPSGATRHPRQEAAFRDTGHAVGPWRHTA
jgi:hypothetical protein